MNLWDNSGFGYSREGRLAAWKNLEDGPETGPECPLTFDLIELARGRLDDARRIADLREHIGKCLRCGQRFEAQRRAMEQLKAGYAKSMAPTNGAEVRQQVVWQASVDPSVMLIDGPDEAFPVPVQLIPSEGIGPVLSGILRWNKGQAGTGETGPWHVALLLHRPADAKDWDAWAELANREVELDLTDKDQERPCLLFLELGRQDDDLISLPAACRLDPPSVRKIRLKTGQRQPRTIYE